MHDKDSGLREMNIPEILSMSAKIFKKNIALIFPLCLLVYLPVNVIEMFLPVADLAEYIFADSAAYADMGRLGESALAALASLVVTFCFTSLITGGFSYIASYGASKTKPDFSGVMEHSIAMWHRLAFTGIMYLAVIFLSSFLIIPAIYFSVSFIFSQNITAITKETGIRALLKSSALVKGRFFRSLAYAAVFTILQVMVVELLGTVAYAVFPNIMGATIGTAALPQIALSIIIWALIQALSSFFVMAQAVWFMSRAALKSAEEKH